MKFEYDVLKDYHKIAENIDKYDLREECLEKLNELGITRIGEILACSETAIDTYGENTKWVKEAREYFVKKLGELDAWKAIKIAEDLDEYEDNPFDEFSCTDEDDPYEILSAILFGVFDFYLTKYKLDTGKKLSETKLNLSDELRAKVGDIEEEILSFFVLNTKDLVESQAIHLDIDTVFAIRKHLTKLLSLPEEIFKLFDEINVKRFGNLRDILKQNQTENSYAS